MKFFICSCGEVLLRFVLEMVMGSDRFNIRYVCLNDWMCGYLARERLNENKFLWTGKASRSSWIRVVLHLGNNNYLSLESTIIWFFLSENEKVILSKRRNELLICFILCPIMLLSTFSLHFLHRTHGVSH